METVREAEFSSNLCAESKKVQILSKFRFAVLAFFFVTLSLTCGCEYNLNGLKYIWRTAQNFQHLEKDKFELLLSQACKIYQTSDFLFGSLSGLLLDHFGSRLTYIVGYAFYIVGLLFTLLPISFLWWGTLLEGFSIQTILMGPICVSSLFPNMSKVTISILFAAPDIAAVVYYLGYYLVRFRIITFEQFTKSQILLSTLTCIVGAVMLPKGISYVKKSKQAAGGAPAQPIDTATKALLPDKTNQPGYSCYDSPSLTAETSMTYNTQASTKRTASFNTQSSGPNTPLLNEGTNEKHSFNLLHNNQQENEIQRQQQQQPSFPKDNVKLKDQPLMYQLFSLYYICMVITTSFMTVRTNLYLDQNETMLQAIGDDDSSMSQFFGGTLFTSCISCIFFGWFMEKYSVGLTITLINFSGIGVNALPLINNLSLQYLTFILLNIMRGGSLLTVAVYCKEFLVEKHFGLFFCIQMIVCGLFNAIIGHFLFLKSRPTAETWKIINSVLIVLGLANFIPSLYLFFQKRDNTPQTNNSTDNNFTSIPIEANH